MAQRASRSSPTRRAEADGINAYIKAHNVDEPPATVNDVIATAAFIGSIFGAGGGAEASNAEFLSELQHEMGNAKGYKAWSDTMLLDDPEAPTTISQHFNYPVQTGGPVTGSESIDMGSIQSVNPVRSTASTAAATTNATKQPLATPPYTDPTYPAAGPVPRKQISNFLVVNPERSADTNTLAAMGPQLGYYYPEIVEQEQLDGPGIHAEGIGVPGMSMYMLIGRTQSYVWSLTSASNDIEDVFALPLCNTDGSTPTRASTHYLYKGVCRAFDTVNAGTLNGNAVVYQTSVHGPVIGPRRRTANRSRSARQRSTFGRDGLNLAALDDMTDGVATTPAKFFTTANEFGFTFNWAYACRTSNGLLLLRSAAGARRRALTAACRLSVPARTTGAAS